MQDLRDYLVRSLTTAQARSVEDLPADYQDLAHRAGLTADQLQNIVKDAWTEYVQIACIDRLATQSLGFYKGSF